MRSTPVVQDVRYRVVGRWDSGGARDTEHTAALLVDATDTATGAAVRLDLSGRAETLQRPDRSLATYAGRPAGPPQGFHVVRATR